MLGFSSVWAEISIQNDQQYLGDDGALHIVGEIQNNLNVPLNQIDVEVTMYSHGKILETQSTSTLINTIMPGMKGPFELVILDGKANLVEDYSLEVNYKVTKPKDQVIDITSSKFTRDNFDNLVITGTVTNLGDITANTISIVATLYDREGTVTAVAKTRIEPDYLRANDETFFFIAVPDKTQTNSVVDYSLVAESEEFATVPEFPLGTMLLLSSSVFVYVILTRYSGRIITNLVSASGPK